MLLTSDKALRGDNGKLTMSAADVVERIRALCQNLRTQTSTEKVLQDALEPLLQKTFSSVIREARLDETDVVDFLIEGTVALEVKVDGSPMAVTRQMMRYLDHDGVKRLVLVTTRRKHVVDVPGTLRGKPVDVAWLSPL